MEFAEAVMLDICLTKKLCLWFRYPIVHKNPITLQADKKFAQDSSKINIFAKWTSESASIF